MLPRVPHLTMWSLVDHLRPYAVFLYGVDCMASAICSALSVKSCKMVVVYDLAVGLYVMIDPPGHSNQASVAQFGDDDE